MTPHMQKLLEIMHFLYTDPAGCPWTQAQTHQSLINHLVEETYETAEAVDTGASADTLRDELGDILLQVVFHAEIANKRGAFSFDDVAKAICDKLERRYPTILGDEDNTLKTPEEIDRRWEEVKAEERKKKNNGAKGSVLDGVSLALPALMRAQKLKHRAAQAGWEWADAQAQFDKITEELGELRAELDNPVQDKTRIAAELGDLLFIITDFARWHGIDAEDALRTTNLRFETRFRHMEAGLTTAGKDFKTSSAQERKALWQEAKDIEAKNKEKRRKKRLVFKAVAGALTLFSFFAVILYVNKACLKHAPDTGRELWQKTQDMTGTAPS